MDPGAAEERWGCRRDARREAAFRLHTGRVDVRKLSDLVAADERTLRFTPLGLSLAGTLDPEDAAELQQQVVASADLIEAVPDGLRASFDRLRTCHSYGVLWYEAFTVASELSSLVLEQALRERFVTFYDSSIPLETKNGEASEMPVEDFAQIIASFGRGGTKAKAGWKLRTRTPGALVPVPVALGSLVRWARAEGLLRGQRNKRFEPLLVEMRNRVAHGTGFRVAPPTESARCICDLAEIINRLWGSATPGGRLYPAPLAREVVALGWTHGRDGVRLAQMRPDQIPQHRGDDEGWSYLLVLAVPTDELFDFDARYEMTRFPCELLWGPGSGGDALTWWQNADIATDGVEYLDRLFAVRVDREKTYLPQQPAVARGLPRERRGGVWHVIRADFPLDAHAHVRHLETASRDSTDETSCTCPIEEIATGAWAAIQDVLTISGAQPARSSMVHLPRRFPFPAEVGYE